MPTDSLPAPYYAPGDYQGIPREVPTQFTPAAPSNVSTPDVPLPLPEGSDNPKHVQVFAFDPLTNQFKPVNWVDGQLSVDATFSGSISVGAVTLKDGASGTLGSIIPVGAVNAQVVTFSATQAPVSVTVSNFPVDPSIGAWSYYAGVSGTVTVAAARRVLGISAHATTAGSMTINGGPVIPIPAGAAFNLEPKGNLVAPTVVFTGTDAYFVEVVS